MYDSTLLPPKLNSWKIWAMAKIRCCSKIFKDSIVWLHSGLCHQILSRNAKMIKLLYTLISISQNYNVNMLAIIWHEIVCWFLKIYHDLKGFVTQEHRIVFVLIFRCRNNFMFPTCKNSQKWVKYQKSTDNHSSIDGLIQEDIDLSDIHLAVLEGES